MREVDIAVVGAGPAGLAASIEAARAGAKVVVIDENSRPGGQLVKQIHKFFGSHEHRAGLRGFEIATLLGQEAVDAGVEMRLATAVWGLFPDNTLSLLTAGVESSSLKAKKVILATGANEKAIAFPGWTLPGVMTAGAFQTFVNVHRVLPGDRVVVVGSGNVGLIVSYQALQAGAKVQAIVEVAPRIGGYGVHANKVLRAGVPIFTSHSIVRAVGADRVEAAIVAQVDEQMRPIHGAEHRIETDVVCLAVGLEPMVELAGTIGCQMCFLPALGGFVPLHNAEMATTLPDIFVAGDVSGVEEASTAMEEGRLASLAAAAALGYVSTDLAAQRKAEIWARLDNLRSSERSEAIRNAKAELMGRVANG